MTMQELIFLVPYINNLLLISGLFIFPIVFNYFIIPQIEKKLEKN